MNFSFFNIYSVHRIILDFVFFTRSSKEWNIKLLTVILSALCPFSLFQIFSLLSYSQTPAIYVLSLMQEPEFHVHTKQQANSIFFKSYFNIYIFKYL